ncbi:MAG: AmmeMemoRadiSam system protein B [Ignavibacteriales bacterium]|nr:AmmeMemoRadiSam system protein B [Ignavibacteriales bacterium]
MNNGIRQSAVAGMFYPSDPDELRSEISKMLDDAETPQISGNIVSLIVPHAGYQYSGLTAAHAYKLLEGKKFDSVIIVSPSHREFFSGISIFSGNSYHTPLGDLKIDAGLRNLLSFGDRYIETSIQGHGKEHAIEVQLPFLQYYLKGFLFLPIVIGNQQNDICFHLGKRLAEVLKNKNALLIASTDLSHFHTYDQARKLDQIVIDLVAKFGYRKLMELLEFEKAEACGGGPMVSVMLASDLLSANRVEILHKCNSGDVTGDTESVVGYFSAAILK